ncbi:hypothetical protein D9619_006192 [Psilocybe cf. subviscida]|uniref:F-box domain-containing protein n=1 Tax=Psilocybe cf. subviscida TaxID=2480587 RepID=A0A8H5B598_9AGAR|nr:hypothetical protein D9619_006192 [Psilocybe cf. subviscida]
MDSTRLQAYALAPISKLPVEVLLEIFDLVIEDSDLMMEWYQEVTHVCRYWRQLAINTPRLWTDIPADSDYNNPYWTHTALERSKPALLNINLHSTRWETNVAVFKHIARITSLALNNCAEELNNMAFILSVVGDDARELTYLTLYNTTLTEGQQVKLPASFSATTKLEHLDLRYVDIDWKSPLLLAQDLTWLTLHNVPIKSAPSWDELMDALARMPRLAVLDLKQALPVTPPRPNTLPLYLSQLRTLIITCNEPSQARSFLSRVMFPPLYFLTIGCDTMEQGHHDYASIIQHVVRKIPTSFAEDFLSLTIDGTLIINNRGIKLTCHSYHDNNLSAGSQRQVNFALASESGFVLEGIIRDVLTLLRLNTTLQSLDFRAPTTISPRGLPRLFGPITTLTTISVLGGRSFYLPTVLQMPINHPPPPPPSFPCLQTIHLTDVTFEREKPAESLENVLIQRYEYGAEIRTLKLVRCPGLDSDMVKRFADIVVDVIWLETYDY